MTYLFILVKILAVAYLAAITLIFFMQPNLIYYPDLPSRKIETTPASIGLNYEDVYIDTDDAIKLHGWFISNTMSQRVLLFFHGNAGNISHRLESIKIFHQLGFSVFILDYRGYGQSQGKTTESGTYRDAEAAMNYLLRKRGINENQITVFGRSLGGAVASYTASKHKVAALILESTFTSAPDMASKVLPWPIFPLRLISRFSYNTQKRLASIQCPILIVHSPEDEIIPFSHGNALYQQALDPKQMLTIRGGHNDGFLISGQTYLKGLQNFVASYSSEPDKQDLQKN